MNGSGLRTIYDDDGVQNWLPWVGGLVAAAGGDDFHWTVI